MSECFKIISQPFQACKKKICYNRTNVHNNGINYIPNINAFQPLKENYAMFCLQWCNCTMQQHKNISVISYIQHSLHLKLECILNNQCVSNDSAYKLLWCANWVSTFRYIIQFFFFARKALVFIFPFHMSEDAYSLIGSQCNSCTGWRSYSWIICCFIGGKQSDSFNSLKYMHEKWWHQKINEHAMQALMQLEGVLRINSF